MTEYIYYAKPIGAPDYMEEVVLETTAPLTPGKCLWACVPGQQFVQG